MNRRGSVALATAAVAVLVIGAAGFAIDNTRVWLVRARLKTASIIGSVKRPVKVFCWLG